MGRIDDLIQKYCPNGVEYVKLGDSLAHLRTGLNPRVHFKLNTPDAEGYYITVRELDGFNIVPTDKTDRINETAVRRIQERSQIKVGDVLFSGTGTIGKTAIVIEEPKNWNVKEGVYIITPKHEILLSRFLIHLFHSKSIKEIIDNYANGSTVRSISMKDLREVSIPLPPLPVQEAIVEILDKFDRLSAELQAELQARKQQYEYYRNQLLTRFAPEQPVTEYSLGELGTITRGNGLQKKDFTESGVGCIHYGQIYTRYKTFTEKTLTYVDESLAKKLLHVEKGDLVIACTSENVEDVCKCVAWLGEDTIVTGGHACVYRHNQNPKYMAYFFQTDYFFQQKKKYAYGAKVIDIKPDSIAKITIPLPSLEEQARIVAILDKFEALVNDLSQGLPAEIAAVQEQYEYYRNKLLTFKTKE